VKRETGLPFYRLRDTGLPGGERKQLPGQAGNDDIDLEGSIILGHDEITSAIGGDIGEGYILVKMKAIPRRCPDKNWAGRFHHDFAQGRDKIHRAFGLGDRGKGALVVKRGTQPIANLDGVRAEFGGGLGSSPGTVQRDVIKGTQMATMRRSLRHCRLDREDIAG